MATNKVNQFVGQYRTDSFDRFGDDLCELLLSYLSFEDKYRLKGVSKQWQRLILNKQKELGIWFESESEDDLSLELDDFILGILSDCCPRLKSIATNRVIVDPFGRQFSADSFDRFGDDMTELVLSYLSFEDKYRLKGVSKQWQRLILNKQTVLEVSYTLSRYSMSISIDNLRQLVKTVEYVKTCDVNRLKNVLKTCPALKTIRFFDYVRVDDQVLDTITQCCPSLESIALEMNFCSKEAINRFGERFGQTLKSIHLKDKTSSNSRIQDISAFCPNPELDQSSSHETKDMKVMKNLKRLVIDGHELEDMFAKVSRLAPNLQTLILRRKTISKTIVDVSSMLSPMPSLKALAIVNYSLIGQLFEALPRMTPNLRVLRLETPLSLFFNREFIDNTIKREAKSIVKRYDSDVTDKEICHLIDNCPQLNDIELLFRTHISTETIDKLIETANKRPKESIAFRAIVPFWERCLVSIWRYAKDKPKNLSIHISTDVQSYSDYQSEESEDTDQESD